MGYRKFVDDQGHSWEVRDSSRSRWDLDPVAGNPGSRITIDAPTYEADPFEMSEGELQRLLEKVRNLRSRPSKSPFLD